MKYIEIIVLINLVIHLCFVKFSNYILRNKRNIWLIGLSMILDSLYVVSYIYFPYHIEKYRYLIIWIISVVPFISKGVNKTLSLSLVYLMFNFTLGGISEIVYQLVTNFWAVIISLILFCFIFSLYSIYKRFHSYNEKLVYDVILKDNNQSFYLQGYCDTGNFLATDNNIPIIFINPKIKIGHFVKEIEVQTVSLKRVISLYEVNDFKIKINKRYVKRDVYIAYANISHMVMFGLNVLGG